MRSQHHHYHLMLLLINVLIGDNQSQPIRMQFHRMITPPIRTIIIPTMNFILRILR